MLTLQVLVCNWSSLLAKLLVVIGGTFAFTLLTYHFGVRYTSMGQWLNGKQYTRPVKPSSVQPLETEG